MYTDGSGLAIVVVIVVNTVAKQRVITINKNVFVLKPITFSRLNRNQQQFITLLKDTSRVKYVVFKHLESQNANLNNPEIPRIFYALEKF